MRYTNRRLPLSLNGLIQQNVLMACMFITFHSIWEFSWWQQVWLQIEDSVSDTEALNSRTPWQRFQQRFNEIVRDVIRFAKFIPGFTELDLNDQISLLKGAGFEVTFLCASVIWEILWCLFSPLCSGIHCVCVKHVTLLWWWSGCFVFSVTESTQYSKTVVNVRFCVKANHYSVHYLFVIYPASFYETRCFVL